MIIALDGFKKKEVRLCNDSRYLNTLILGQKGTGKSDHVLVNMFFQDLKTRDHSLIVFTSKGDTSYKLYTLAKHMGRKVHLIKPEINTFNINLLKGEEAEVLEYMVQLLGQSFQNGQATDMYYQEINKTLLVYSIKIIKRLLGEKGTMEDLYHLMGNVNGAGRKRIMEFSRLLSEDIRVEKENAHIASWFLNDYFADNKERRIFDACGAMRMKIRSIVDVQNMYSFSHEEEDLPDFKKVLKNKEILIVDTEFSTYKEYAKLMGTYLLLKVKNELLQMETADTFMYVDDFQKYYPVLTELLEESHLKNIGVTLFLQDTHQLNHDTVYKNVVLNNVSNLILLERISFDDYRMYKEHVNAELLNRKRGEIVYRIINREGTSESTNGTLYTNEKLILHYEKYLDYKKSLMKKKRKRIVPAKRADESVEEPPKAEWIQPEEKTEKIPEMIPEHEETVLISEPVQTPKLKKPFEQIKREGDGKEYLSPDAIFEEEENEE